MTTRRTALVAFTLAGLLSACATQPPTWGESKLVPLARVVQADLGTGARIVVTRDVGVAGGGCFTSLRVNGQLVARMDAGERLSLDVAPGTVIIAPGRDPDGRGLCAIGKGFEVPREFQVQAETMRMFRVVVGPGGLDVYPAH